MATLQCTVATPTRELFNGEIYYANVPGVEGSFGVMAGHELLVSTDAAGGLLTLQLDESGTQKKQFLLYEGAAQVFQNHLTVLGRFGKNVEDINVEDVKAGIADLEAKIAEYEASDAEQDKAALETHRSHLAWYQKQLAYAGASA